MQVSDNPGSEPNNDEQLRILVVGFDQAITFVTASLAAAIVGYGTTVIVSYLS